MEEKSAENSIHSRLRHAIALCAPVGDGDEKWSLKVFAREADIPYRTLQDYLSGQRLPGADALRKLAKKGIDVNWILLGDEIINSSSLVDKTQTAAETVIHLSDKMVSSFIDAMGHDWLDRENVNRVTREGLPFRFLSMIELYERYRSEITVAYLRTIEAMPHFKSKGMNYMDMLKVLEQALEPILIDTVAEVAEKYRELPSSLAQELEASHVSSDIG